MEQYLVDKKLSKDNFHDALKKAWQEKGLQKDSYDFWSLIMAIASTAIPDGEQSSIGQAPAVHIETAVADQHENLLEDFRQCLKDVVRQVPVGLQHVFLTRDNGIAIANKNVPHTRLKQYREGAGQTI